MGQFANPATMTRALTMILWVCLSLVCVKYVCERCIHKCVWVQLCMHGVQRRAVCVLIYHSPLYSFETVSLTEPEVGWWPVGRSHLLSLSQSTVLGLQAHAWHPWHFVWMLGWGLKSQACTADALNTLNHLPTPHFLLSLVKHLQHRHKVYHLQECRSIFMLYYWWPHSLVLEHSVFAVETCITTRCGISLHPIPEYWQLVSVFLDLPIWDVLFKWHHVRESYRRNGPGFFH